MAYKIIDLFAGAGGLTTGFHLAGFESLCAIEVEAKALATYSNPESVVNLYLHGTGTDE